VSAGLIGAPLPRIEGTEKVTGAARYAYEGTPEGVLYGWPVQSTVATGTITGIDIDAARSLPGVVEVLTAANAPRLQDADDGELMLLQSDVVSYRGQVVALVVAETIDTAREAAGRLAVTYQPGPADVVLTDDHPKLYDPDEVNAGFPADTSEDDVTAGLAASAVTVDATYSTPAQFNNPMEPHASIASWADGRLDVVDSSQGTSSVRDILATLFSLAPEQIRVRAEHVGGGFGSKGSPRPNVVLAVMATMATDRPVKIAYTRQMMFALAGYRTPTISRIRLGADEDGRLTAISHQAYSHTSTIEEFVEQTAEVSRHIYAAPNRLMTHRVAALDVPTPRWMRAPGECPGMFALESAMDELAAATGIDPVELRVRNEPEVDPESGAAFSSRNLVACLRLGAERFGWSGRDPRPAARRDGRWLVGSGVASAAYPAMAWPSGARLTAYPDGTFRLGVNATDIGTGARTVLRQIAADVLGCAPERIVIDIADSDLPNASVAGGSAGTASWGWAVHKACTQLLAALATGGPVPAVGLQVEVSTEDDIAAMAELDRHAFGAHFVEVRVDLDSGEVVVPRMVGVFAAGRIMNARTARSQLIGGITMGLSMALHEHGELDALLGDYANHDLATYHIAASLDVPEIEVEWLEEHDDHLTPLGGKGIGEIGIVGSAAAVANAVWHATGIRVRDLPIQPDKLIADLPARF
jgi:xanthine dehydrogenase YagR molybdenum-binding subunit